MKIYQLWLKTWSDAQEKEVSGWWDGDEISAIPQESVSHNIEIGEIDSICEVLVVDGFEILEFRCVLAFV